MKGAKLIFQFKTRKVLVTALLLASMPVWSSDVVWSCSRAEPEPEKFDRLRPYRIENLTARDLGGIAITLTDLYAAYGGQSIQMGSMLLTVCTLPANDPIQVAAMELLGYSPQDLEDAARLPTSRLVLAPTIHRMQKCIVENHPAVGFFEDVVESERVGPCF
jgi:hypothetical protein